jgi:hypothetical protein
MRLATIVMALTLALINIHAQTPEKLASIWDAEHVTRTMPSDMRQPDVKKYLDGLKKIGLRVDQVGVSFQNREIYQVEWGTGPLKVFMWSQMHGDEPTATSALMDMFTYLHKHRNDPEVKQMSSALTIRAVPMLNPDGAEMYQRRSSQDIDINRDAVDLKTPEARLLKQLRDSWMPDIGFNLHNQQSLTTVGHSPFQATISVLVVYGDAAKTTSAGLERNTRVISAIVNALNKFIPGHIAQYSDEYTSTAFGDNFTAWGTPTILIETGALYGKDEMYLVKLNFVAFLTALESIASGSEKNESTAPYLSLIPNASGTLVNFMFRNANVVSLPAPGGEVSIGTSDIGCVAERRRASFLPMTTIRAMGSLGGLHGLEEYDASGFYVLQRWGQTRTGQPAELLFYKRDRTIDWTAADVEKQFPPDAILSGGKWFLGAGVVPKK